MTPNGGRPARVAIVGGGCAGVSAAFELTRPEHGGAFQVTLYQQGWRLGGKGASGRGPAGRVEEHGLHLWLGYYENAFRLLRECYAELGRPPGTPFATWREAFQPLEAVGVAEEGSDAWSTWLAHFPSDHRTPGDPDPPPLYDPAFYLERLIGLVGTLVESAVARPGLSQPLAAPLAVMVGLAIQAIEVLRTLGRGATRSQSTLTVLLDGLARGTRAAMRAVCTSEPALRRTWEIVDIALGNARGIVADGLLSHPDGFDAINHLDYREWLGGHGVDRASLDSAVIRGLYSLCFAYEDGDASRPRFAAGQALRCAMRAFFTYKGSVFWKMNAGMGDVVFAPFYEVLERRGVEFAFFHRLHSLRLAGEPPHVGSLVFDVQATPASGSYQPLVTVRGLPCWPATADYGQLSGGDALAAAGPDLESHHDPWRLAERELFVGQDFDFVILAVGFGALPFVAGEIIERDPRWQSMMASVKTVATRSMQLWLKQPFASLGLRTGPAAVSALSGMFDTWADMTHVLPAEDWALPPKALAYFCSALPDGPALPEGAGLEASLRQDAVRFLEGDLLRLWPGASDSEGNFRWDLLASPDGAPPPGRRAIESQYLRVNQGPSDRYVLSLPGTIATRISPLDPTYDNLAVAGDWTDCGFNCGCVEAAVMSGRLAAHAISGAPALEEITGFDHP